MRSWILIALATSSITAQGPLKLYIDYPPSVVRQPAETVEPYGPASATPTGMQESLGVDGWYSAGATAGSYTSNVLVAGVGQGGVGEIRHFTRLGLSSASYALNSATSVPGGIIPAGIAFEEVSQKLYLIDRVSEIVFVADWDGVSPLNPNLSPWFDASSFIPQGPQGTVAVPALELRGGDRDKIYDGALPRESVVAATRIRITTRDSSRTFMYGSPTFATVDIASQVGAPEVLTPPNGDNFVLDEESFREGASQVVIRVGLGYAHSYTLVRVDTGAVLGSATQVATDEEVSIPSSVPLEVGVEYGVYRVGQPTELHIQRCMVRYGIPGELTSVGAIEMGRLQFGGPFVAGQVLQTSCPVKATTATPVLIATAITVGGQDAQGGYPIVPISPDHYLINSNENFPLQLRVIKGTVGSWVVYAPISVPNTPQAVGLVFVMQAVAVDGSAGVYFSDILGGAVLAP